MKTDLYVYTGTGNSLWVARQLAKELKGATLQFMPLLSTQFKSQADRVGLIFPVHMWGLPARVIQFVDHLKVKPEACFFALAVNAGQTAATLLQLNKRLKVQGEDLTLGYSLVLPSNYIPWGGPGPIKTQRRLFQEARRKVRDIARSILQYKHGIVERGPVWQNILFSCLYKISFNRVCNMDKNFWVDEKCNNCGVCSEVCPAGNIMMVDERPTWLHRCEQCLACLQWCPKEAIQYKGKTFRYPRYHHPEVDLGDMLEQARTVGI